MICWGGKFTNKYPKKSKKNTKIRVRININKPNRSFNLFEKTPIPQVAIINPKMKLVMIIHEAGRKQLVNE